MNFLLSEGHLAARKYPIAVVWSEVRWARRRWHERMETEATLMHATIADVISGKGHLNKALKRLRKNGD